ncbi:ATP-binding cassette domain-containing protein [Paenibacillus antri]|uniref:ATP-binding cassette domain-containing protein n=2 Tax=Paenibacillus antri TaxID=2582848 RepID=A0A5R9G290_9BACL|nr:ATP-binding cassette domain-containing protein [Paenibacillus antri]TLS48416.1 ATP-binding cassette domain-containing protein [Paenibacillus antri]
MNDAIITVQGLKKRYGSRVVLDGIDFAVQRGSIFALLGENGAGKTTTVRALTTLLRPDEGIARVGGFDCVREAANVRRIVSLTGQFAGVDELLTGRENLRMMGRLYRLDRRTANERADRLLERFDLVETADALAKTYSGGMRRKLDIAVSLLAEPQALFLDEPTTGLDPRSRLHLWEMISELARGGTTVFLTTQYLEEAERLADRIAVVHRGRIAAEGTAEQLKRLVGGGRIELSFRSEAEAAGGARLLNGRIEDRSVSVPVAQEGSSFEELRLALNLLHDFGLEPTGVEIRKPTLDDVFLGLTGDARKEAAG